MNCYRGVYVKSKNLAIRESLKNIVVNIDSYIDKDELRRIGSPIERRGVGVTLAAWLAEHYLFYGPAEWLIEIQSGRVTVNQRVVTDPAYQLALHDQLARVHALSEEPTVDTTFHLLYQSSDIAVVAKPPGLPMHEAGFYRRKTVHWLLPKFLGSDWHAVHRLDRETSGVLVCARGRSMREALAKQIERGDVEKTYLAVCQGTPVHEMWTEECPIVPARSPLEASYCAHGSDGQAAVTGFRVIDKNNTHALIEAVPRTGRTHQIRVHLAHAGLPIVGDKIYGPCKDVFAAYIKEGNTQAVQKLAGHPRHLLHAHRISFKNPQNGDTISVESPMTDDMQTYLN